MRTAVFLAISLVCAAAAGAAEKGERAADFTVKDMAGNPVKLADLRGSVVIVDFWASWCAPCKKELPALEGLARRWQADKKPVIVLSISIDKERANAEKTAKAASLAAVRVALDPEGSVASQYDLPTMPSSFVIDQKGIIRFVQRGYEAGDEKKVAEQVEALLKAQAQ